MNSFRMREEQRKNPLPFVEKLRKLKPEKEAAAAGANASPAQVS